MCNPYAIQARAVPIFFPPVAKSGGMGGWVGVRVKVLLRKSALF